MIKPRITIGIPCYNMQEYLADAIDSALTQKYAYFGEEKSLEVIVVDDGSTDNSLAIAKGYESKGVKVIHQVNKGLASARNTVIMNVSGEYILFLDADDILLDSCVEAILNKIDETGADIISPSFRTFGLQGAEIILMENPTLEDFKTGNRVGYCSAIKREALLECGGYSPRMTWGFEDYHIWFDLLSRGKKIITIPQVLWLYRTKERSMIYEANEHADELMAQIKKDFRQVYE